MIYDLFVYSFYYERQNQTQQNDTFELNKFSKVVGFEKQIDIIQAGKVELHALQARVQDQINTLPAPTEITQLKDYLADLGVNPENVYLFIKGHTLQDNVVLMFLKPIVKFLKEEKYKEIDKTETQKIAKNQKREQYKKQTQDIELILKTHKNYENSQLFKKITKDITDFIQTTSNPKNRK